MNAFGRIRSSLRTRALRIEIPNETNIAILCLQVFVIASGSNLV